MKTLEQLCEAALARDSERQAVEFEGRWYSWSQMRQVADQVAHLLQESGVNPQAAVTFVPRNRPSALATLLVLFAQGRSVRMLYAFQSAAGLARQLEQHKPAVVIAAERDFSPEVTEVLRASGIAGIAIDEMEAHFVAGCERSTTVGSTSPTPAARQIEILTSGTTGTPKQFPISYALIEQFMVGDALRSGQPSDFADVPPALLYFPLGNITGIHTTVPALLKGQRVVLLDRFSLAQWHDFVVRYRPATSGIPPAAMQALLDANIPPADLASLKSMGSGAAPLDPSIHHAFEARYGIPILLSYGATEFGGPVTAMTVALHEQWGKEKFGSVGRALPGFQLRVVDAATNAELPPGEEGILEVISPRIGTDWLHTADVAVLDADGFLFLRGRADGAIMRGGFKVLPETIERALLLHPAVAAASVVGMPDPRLSEVPCAAIQLKAGCAQPDVAELETHLRSHLLATQIPVHWRLVEDLPKTPSFKVDRPAVKRLFEEASLMQPDHRFLDDLTDTSTRVEPALVVDNPDSFGWDEQCDVLVVGVGLAGVCAALRAAEDRNLQVIAIDRGEGGGASKMSGGVVYMGGGTKAQREAGVEDSPENMANYLAYETGSIVRPDTVRRFAEASVHFQDWLEKYGVRFGGPATADKTSYPSDATLYFSGNELTVPGRALATPAQRGHRAKPSQGGEPTQLSGHYLLPPLIESFEQQPNARLLRQTRATRLIVDKDGSVIGIEVQRIASAFARWRHARYMSLASNLIAGTLGLSPKLFGAIINLERTQSQTLRIRVRKGVVLSAGGFTYNRAMMAKTALPSYLKSHPLGTIADDGSGIKLGMSVGGKTAMLDRVSAWKFLYPPESWVKSCSVGPDGKRLVGEEYYGARTGDAVFGPGGGNGWLIMDEPLQTLVRGEIKVMKKMLFQIVQFRAIQNDYTVSAPTLAELAAKIGVPADRMVETLAAYNGYIDQGEADPLGKSEKYRRKIDTGPFYATSIGAANRLSPIPALTMGGLVVDEDTGEVLSSAGGVVKGLYAAGRTAVGICSYFYVSGLSLGDCVWSGLRAAEMIKGNGGAKALAPNV